MASPIGGCPAPLPGFYGQAGVQKGIVHGSVGRFCAIVGLSALGHIHRLAAWGQREGELADGRAQARAPTDTHTLWLGVIY